MTTSRNRSRGQAPAASGNPPTHLVKQRRGGGTDAHYERIGAAWQQDNGSIFVRLSGTQIVSDGFSLWPVDDREDGGAR